MFWRTMRQKEIGEHFENDPRVESALHSDCQAFPRELVDDAQHPKRFAVIGSIHHEFITPYMIAVLRTQPHAGAVVQP